jgi:hypothetical protein
VTLGSLNEQLAKPKPDSAFVTAPWSRIGSATYGKRPMSAKVKLYLSYA